MRDFIAYTLIALVLSIVDFHFAGKAFKKTGRIGRALGWSAACSGIITLAYLGSVHTKNSTWVSLSSSIAFISIDCMLVSVAYYAFLVTGVYRTRWSQVTNNAIRILACLDILIMIANVFTGVAVAFDSQLPFGIKYRMKPLYVIHLTFAYSIVILTLIVLIRKSVKTPRKYRNQYLLIIVAIGVVVLMNAIFLFHEEDSFFAKVDCSTFGYSLGLFLMYWTAYEYKQNDMLNSLSKSVIDNVSQGIVLFDYMDGLIMYNHRARELLKGVPLNSEMPCRDYCKAIGIPEGGDEDYSVQCDIEGGVPMRCDYRPMKDERDGTIGRLYVFTDITRDMDLTTGFQYAKDYRYTDENESSYPEPSTVIVFDIVGLREINRSQSRDTGDRLIRSLAKRMRQCLPEDTTFLRGFEAYLIAICPGTDENSLLAQIEKIIKTSPRLVLYGMSANVDMTLSQALHSAYQSIQIKKLLCRDSSRSQSLASLVRALKEADADTEDHVERTQKMGAMLGRRIRLDDVALTQLELLCLLHDIGKIGIPLEILNKPGKLVEQEWEVLRTHPQKGYQIATSTDELRPIADMILYHHERWDGKGYPEGLSGENIPILSRIIAIVDAYDAMVNDRSYRKALSPEKAQAELVDNAGTQFDPELVRKFLCMLSENPEIAKGEKVDARVDERRESDAITGANDTEIAMPIAYSRYTLDVNETIIETDDRFEEITGYARSEVIGRMKQWDLIPLEERRHYMLLVNKQLTCGDVAYLRHEIRRKDNEQISVVCCGRRYYDSAAKAFRNDIIIFQL